MKRQTGVWIDSQIWNVYRRLCKCEKLLPSEPITEFLGFILQNGSPSAVTNMIKVMIKERTESIEAYAHVLLNWYANGKTWMHVTDESEAAIEPMLLQVLKDVIDPQLRTDIQETLLFKPHRQTDRIGRKKKSREKPMTEPAKTNIPKRIGDIKNNIAHSDIDAEQAQEMLRKIHQIREKFKSDRKNRARQH